MRNWSQPKKLFEIKLHLAGPHWAEDSNLFLDQYIFFFFQVDCPDGELGKDKILDMYSMILPVGNAKVFVDQIFRIFDKDGNGTIDFKVCTY